HGPLDPSLLPPFPTRRSSDLSGARNPETEQAFQTQRAGERADLTGGAGAAGDVPSTLAALRGGTSPTTITGEFSPEIRALFGAGDRKSTRLNSSHDQISYAVF